MTHLGLPTHRQASVTSWPRTRFAAGIKVRNTGVFSVGFFSRNDIVEVKDVE